MHTKYHSRSTNICFVFVAASMLCFPFVSVHAQVAPGAKCAIFLNGAAEAPLSLKNLIAQRHDSAADACVDHLGNVSAYSSLSLPIPKPLFGVCEFLSHHIDLKAGAAAGKTTGDVLYMALAPGECPQQVDSHYIQTAGVSEGVFASILRFFAESIMSRENFESAIISSNLKQMRDQVDYGTMLSDMIAAKSLVNFGIRSISLKSIENGVSNTGYSIIVASTSSTYISWRVVVDLGVDGFRVIMFEKIIS